MNYCSFFQRLQIHRQNVQSNQNIIPQVLGVFKRPFLCGNFSYEKQQNHHWTNPVANDRSSFRHIRKILWFEISRDSIWARKMWFFIPEKKIMRYYTRVLECREASLNLEIAVLYYASGDLVCHWFRIISHCRSHPRMTLWVPSMRQTKKT